MSVIGFPGVLQRQETLVVQRDGAISSLRDGVCTQWASGWLAFQMMVANAYPGLDLNFDIPNDEEAEESFSADCSCKTREIFNFWKNGKIVISVKNPKFILYISDDETDFTVGIVSQNLANTSNFVEFQDSRDFVHFSRHRLSGTEKRHLM